ncbi:hypothetical protein BST28156_01042 [Burkholderia stagnalis]|nr:hypothetical protein BST28156_01042 [Burkholderia stagnalis]
MRLSRACAPPRVGASASVPTGMPVNGCMPIGLAADGVMPRRQVLTARKVGGRTTYVAGLQA